MPDGPAAGPCHNSSVRVALWIKVAVTLPSSCPRQWVHASQKQILPTQRRLAVVNSRTFSPSTIRVLNAPTMRITKHTFGSAKVTLPGTKSDEYLIGWDLGYSVLQLIVETFLSSFRPAHLKKNLHLQSLSLRMWTWLSVRSSVCLCFPQISTLPTDIDSSPGQRVYQLRFCWFQGFHILCDNPELGLGLLGLRIVLVLGRNSSVILFTLQCGVASLILSSRFASCWW